MFRLRIVFLLFLAISSLFLIVMKYWCSNDLRNIQKIHEHHQMVIENEMRRIFTDCCGYTLIGEKPASIEYCEQRELSTQENRIFFFNELERIFKDSKKFILKIYHSDIFYSEITLINTSLVRDLAVNNRYFSKFIVNHYGDIENFFKILSNPQIHIVEALKWDMVAIGIILGYGTENSKFFQRYQDLGFHLKKYPFICLLPFEPKPLPLMLTPISFIVNVPFKSFIPKKTSKFVSLEDELEELEKMRNSGDFKEMEIPYLFQLPFFLAKKGNKSDRLHRKYLRARDKLSTAFFNKKFQDVIPQMVSE